MIYCGGCEYLDQNKVDCHAPNIVRNFRGLRQKGQFASKKNVDNDCSDFKPESRSWLARIFETRVFDPDEPRD